MTTPMRRAEEPPPEPSRPTRWVEPGPLWAGGVATAVVAALIALVATAIMHLLLLTTPRPQLFFGWIIALGTLVAVVYPFSTTAPLDQKVATATVNLILGIAIGMLINGVAARAVRRRLPSGYQPSPPPYPPPSRTPGDQYR